MLITHTNVNKSIQGIGHILHSAAIEPKIKINICQLLSAKGGNGLKLEKEKVTLFELYMLYAKAPENNIVAMYAGQCKISVMLSLLLP